MKKILLILWVFVLISCSNKDTRNTKVQKEEEVEENIIQNEIMNKEKEYYTMDTVKRFDINRYNKNLKPNEGIIYTFKDANGSEVEQFETHDSYVENIKKTDELFTTYNEYNKKGVLRKSGLYFHNNGFHYGVWRFYDDSGHLVEAIDYEKPYKFTWEDMLEFIKKENINLQATSTYIYRGENALDGKYWRISWDIKSSSTEERGRRIVQLDGDSGKILSEEYFPGAAEE